MSDRLKALENFPYNGKNIYIGDEFDAVRNQDAETLVLLNKAVRVQSGEYLTADLQAAIENVEPVKRKRGRPPKGAYLRRDLRAKE